ncbi:Helicase PriA essential for oriC/DnaA-independent DNA replication [invertebrate metagenome]|uniref:DNA 3'-5' helicase n=1 Tax=invertebrate metagenome TaxID=1711999 RepID=A0A484HB70_9ZZZZ
MPCMGRREEDFAQVSSSGRFANEHRVAVLLPLPLTGPYDYSLPTVAVAPPGTFVRVPLGGRIETGVVWHRGCENEVGRESKIRWQQLRSVQTVLDMPALPEVVMQFIDWVAYYTLSPPGIVLSMVVSIPINAYSLLDTSNGTIVRRIAAARQSMPYFPTGKSPVWLPGAVPRQLDPDHTQLTLSPVQTAAAAALVAAVRANQFSITLLEGVTGSGKTEVYFEAVAEALRYNRQVLVLLPEIALTVQWLDRFAGRFGLSPATWHSELTTAARRGLWHAVAHGRVRVVVGARSALFLPYSDLGLIVVDEEHERAFKQEGRVLYHARDMAVVRGQLGKHAVILASATPSLETHVNVAVHRYGLVQLSVRYDSAPMPSISAIDMRYTHPERGTWGQSWLSPPLIEAVQQTLANGEQVMLFLNRRGYAPLILCRACGFRFRCPHCAAWLVEHRHPQGLRCHHCGYVTDLPRQCPHCSSHGPFAICGPGVERIAEEVTNRFPAARLALMTSDNIKGAAAAMTLMQRMAAGTIDVLIGTQMMAKGHHFPHLTLVGIVDADLGLAGGDLRAAERTFQLLSQVAGRAGRAAGRPGRVLVQTYDPLHPVMEALLSGTHEHFYAAEAAQRRDTGMPPFGQLVALIISGPDGAAVGAVAAELASHGPYGPGVTVLGPAQAPLAVLRDRHRYRLLLKASRSIRVQPLLRAWLEKIQWPRTVRVQVDVNPYNFL